jgi:hypothetical protein
MRRGYYGWDETELPLTALEARCTRLQAAMRAEKLDGLLLYTNIARPAAVSWLTGFVPYWSEGMLFVPPDGTPDFATALSKRVGEWMRSVTPIGSMVNTPHPAAFFGKRLAERGGAARLGVLELDLLPGGQAAALFEAAPSVELVDATDLFQRVRLQRDDAERGLFRAAARIAEDSVAAFASHDAGDTHRLMGEIEKAARNERVEEIFVTVAPDLARANRFLRVDKAPSIGTSFAIRLSLGYKSVWVRRAFSVSRDAATAAAFAQLDEAFARCVKTLDAARPIAQQIEAAIAPVQNARLVTWTLECCRGSYPLEIVAGDGVGEADALVAADSVLSVEVALGDVRWIVARPLVGH